MLLPLKVAFAMARRKGSDRQSCAVVVVIMTVAAAFCNIPGKLTFIVTAGATVPACTRLGVSHQLNIVVVQGDGTERTIACVVNMFALPYGAFGSD